MESIRKYWWIPVAGGIVALLAYYYWRFIKPCLPPPGNIVKNPSFEEGTSGWLAFRGYWTDDDHWCGKHCFMGRKGEVLEIRQPLEPMKRPAIYRFQFRYRAESIEDRMLVNMLHTYGARLFVKKVPGEWSWDVENGELYAKLIYDRPLSRGWREVLVEFQTGEQAPPTEEYLDIYLPTAYQRSLKGNFYIDDVWLWFKEYR